ncbi:hypothetical protein [Gaiella sp.]|nr:hypothetical protein [Gaiella sp.]HEX5585480.1 hypothetical protein [Gaiella sp.]
MATAPTYASGRGSPMPLKRGVVAALLFGAVLGRLANFWSRV